MFLDFSNPHTINKDFFFRNMIPTFYNLHWNIVHDTRTILLEHVLTFDPLQPSLQTFGSHLKFELLRWELMLKPLDCFHLTLCTIPTCKGVCFYSFDLCNASALLSTHLASPNLGHKPRKRSQQLSIIGP
jgi:hypothetical protein